MKTTNIFIDADESALNESKAVIICLNEKYNIIPKKTINDLSDENFMSIYSGVTKEEIEEIKHTPDFLARLTYREDFNNFLRDIREENVRIYINTNHPNMFIPRDNIFINADEYKQDIDGRSIMITGKSEHARNFKDGIRICIRHTENAVMSRIGHNENIYFMEDWKQVKDSVKFFLTEGESI